MTLPRSAVAHAAVGGAQGPTLGSALAVNSLPINATNRVAGKSGPRAAFGVACSVVMTSRHTWANIRRLPGRGARCGPSSPSQHFPNDAIHAIVHSQPELIGIGAVDSALQGQDEALVEAERAVRTLGLAGINIEPGFGKPARHPDAPIYFSLYDLAQQLDVPVFLMSGPDAPDPRYNDPAALARIAQQFPHLPLVVYHGYWPRVQATIGIAFRYENVYLVPDMYLFQPGSHVYVDAANGFLGDQLLFGSSYPFRPITQSIDDFLALGFHESMLDKLLYGNAARLLLRR